MTIELKKLTNLILCHMSPGGYYVVLKREDIAKMTKEQFFAGGNLCGITENAYIHDVSIDLELVQVVMRGSYPARMGSTHSIGQFSVDMYYKNAFYTISEGTAWKERAYMVDGIVCEDGEEQIPRDFIDLYEFIIRLLGEEGTTIDKPE